MKPSPFKTVTDQVHEELAVSLGQPWRNEGPYYRYGHEDFGSNEGTFPRVRYREEGDFAWVRLQMDDAGTTKLLFRQTVLMQLWTETVDEHIDESARIIELFEATGMLEPIDEAGLNGIWAYDEDGKPVTTAGFMSVLPLVLYATPDTSINTGEKVVLKHIVADVRIDDQHFTTVDTSEEDLP